MKILQVSTSDISGGAERIAWTLLQNYTQRGHQASLAVGYKYSENPDVVTFRHETYRNIWARAWLAMSKRLSPLKSKHRWLNTLYYLSYYLGHSHLVNTLRGYENFSFPATTYLLDELSFQPDIVHCHNLHGNYFDLRALSLLSHQRPVVVTLHDAWLLSGHCAHSLECGRWETGCGHCPDLKLYPGIVRDATEHNWKRKQEIYAQSRVYIATPCQWLMQKVHRSMLAQAAIETQVIPHGVDLTVFTAASKSAVRTELGIRQDARVMLFAAQGIRQTPWKDYQTLRSSVEAVSEQLSTHEELLFLALGETGADEQIGRARIQFIPFQQEPKDVARFYQAADVYVHAAKADTFPNTVLEALACGTPVVATAVGGIPEQIDAGKTGFLVPPGNVSDMAQCVHLLLRDAVLRSQMEKAAEETARQRFDVNRMVDEYLLWYQRIVHSYTTR